MGSVVGPCYCSSCPEPTATSYYCTQHRAWLVWPTCTECKCWMQAGQPSTATCWVSRAFAVVKKHTHTAHDQPGQPPGACKGSRLSTDMQRVSSKQVRADGMTHSSEAACMPCLCDPCIYSINAQEAQLHGICTYSSAWTARAASMKHSSATASLGDAILSEYNAAAVDGLSNAGVAACRGFIALL